MGCGASKSKPKSKDPASPVIAERAYVPAALEASNSHDDDSGRLADDELSARAVWEASAAREVAKEKAAGDAAARVVLAVNSAVRVQRCYRKLRQYRKELAEDLVATATSMAMVRAATMQAKALDAPRPGTPPAGLRTDMLAGLYAAIDADADGKVSAEDCMPVLLTIHLGPDPLGEAMATFNAWDRDESGDLSRDEFVAWMLDELEADDDEIFVEMHKVRLDLVRQAQAAVAAGAEPPSVEETQRAFASRRAKFEAARQAAETVAESSPRGSGAAAVRALASLGPPAAAERVDGSVRTGSPESS